MVLYQHLHQKINKDFKCYFGVSFFFATTKVVAFFVISILTVSFELYTVFFIRLLFRLPFLIIHLLHV